VGGRKPRSDYQSPYASKFRRKLNAELGDQWLMTRAVQSEFQVPLSLDSTGTGQPIEPAAQYCWPRSVTAGSAEKDEMWYPWCTADVQAFLDNCFTSNQILYQNAILFKNFFTCRYTAEYSVRNQTNFPVRYEILRFRCKRDIYRKTDTNHRDYTNPFNMASLYLYRLADQSAADSSYADNRALHTNRVKFEQIPTITSVFSCRKKYRTLQPGQVIHYTIHGKKTFNVIDLVGDTIVGTAASWAHPQWFEGTKWMAFKMLSDSADYTGADGETGNILHNESTRTTPACLLTYEIKYNVLVPNSNRETKVKLLGSAGIHDAPTAGTIANMADSDEKESVQIVVD